MAGSAERTDVPEPVFWEEPDGDESHSGRGGNITPGLYGSVDWTADFSYYDQVDHHSGTGWSKTKRAYPTLSLSADYRGSELKAIFVWCMEENGEGVIEIGQRIYTSDGQVIDIRAGVHDEQERIHLQAAAFGYRAMLPDEIDFEASWRENLANLQARKWQPVLVRAIEPE